MPFVIQKHEKKHFRSVYSELCYFVLEQYIISYTSLRRFIHSGEMTKYEKIK